MGAAGSTLSKRWNPNDIKTILNFILKELFSRVDLVDLYSLADPNRCSRYLVVAADALDKILVRMNLFPKQDLVVAADALDKILVRMNLFPKQGKGGVFYFQSVEAMMKNPPPAIKDEREKNCKDLAFFFIRIFQNFGALTLSVIDSEMPASDPVAPGPAAGRKQPQKIPFLMPPGLPGFPQPAAGAAAPPRGFSSFFARGGALRSDGAYGSDRSFYLDPTLSGPYKLLNTYLLDPSSLRDPTPVMRFESIPALEIEYDSLYEAVPLPAAALGVPPAMAMVPPRQTKNLTAPDASIQMTYRYKRREKLKSIKGTVKFELDGDLLRLQLNIKNPKGAGKDLIVQKGLEDATSRRPTGEDGKELPAVLRDMFEEVLTRIDPAPFSLLDLLKTRTHLKQLDKNIYKVEGTDVRIRNPPSTPTDTLKLTYIGEIEVGEGRRRQIGIESEMTFTEQPGGDPKRYTVKISYESGKLKVSPAELREYLDIPSNYTQATFQVGDTSTSPLTQPDDRKSFSEFVEGAFKKLIESVNEEGFLRGGIQFTREGLPKPINSAEIDDAYRVRKLWEALAKDPPVKSHCIARAVQLLNVAAIQGSAPGGYSSVCRIKFPYIQDGSLPTPGDSITSEYGLAATANLFFEKTLGIASPKLVSDKKFVDFGTRMKELFERDPNPFNPKAGLTSIADRMLPYCRGHTTDVIQWDGKKDAAILNSLKARARALVDRQVRHIGTVMRLLYEIFNQKQVEAHILEFNPRLLAGGMDALNELTVRIREALIEYYSDCEETYKGGLMEIYKENQKRAAVAPLMPNGRKPDAALNYTKINAVPTAAAPKPAAKPAAASGASGP